MDLFYSDLEIQVWVVASIPYGLTLDRLNLRPSWVALFSIFNAVII